MRQVVLRGCFGPCMQIPNSSCLLFSLVPSDDDEDEDGENENEDEDGEDKDSDDDDDDDDTKHERYEKSPAATKRPRLRLGYRGFRVVASPGDWDEAVWGPLHKRSHGRGRCRVRRRREVSSRPHQF